MNQKRLRRQNLLKCYFSKWIWVLILLETICQKEQNTDCFPPPLIFSDVFYRHYHSFSTACGTWTLQRCCSFHRWLVFPQLPAALHIGTAVACSTRRNHQVMKTKRFCVKIQCTSGSFLVFCRAVQWSNQCLLPQQLDCPGWAVVAKCCWVGGWVCV